MNNSLLPHRYPFLFIDRVVESEPGKWVKGYKFITENDWFITENQKEMPFSIIIEAWLRPLHLLRSKTRLRSAFCLR
ncbi:3-hydroxyacyl-[acyl-carrier-protein] dehydratase FabZ [Bacillus paralicheniformis]|nr:3-hydroxyacyl-[acyl-carrier-protein] dehydratase FabZ [Bacillus paralicheniformis]